MHSQNHFNLVDEPWIPIAGHGLASLSDVFTKKDFRALGGNPIQKIALTKLLLAICQVAATPQDDEEWAEMGADGMAKKALKYLQEKRDCFWLYGEKPFLQMPKVYELIKKREKDLIALSKSRKEELEAKKSSIPSSFGTGDYPDLPSANNTILMKCQCSRVLTDAEKAVFIVALMNFAFAGKRVNKDVPPLSDGFKKSVSAKPGPSLGNHWGYLHTFLGGSDLMTMLWVNLITQDVIKNNVVWVNGVGHPPWEQMPSGEDCIVAKRLHGSYMACLIAVSRFVYLDGDGIHYVEGLQYPSHKEGWREPSISVDESMANPKLLWVDPKKRPWKELTSLLSFVASNQNSGFDCQQIRLGFNRARKSNIAIGIWSGGLKLRATTGDQSVKQDDDFVESEFTLPSSLEIGGTNGGWFPILNNEMKELESLSTSVYGCTLAFYKAQLDEGKKQAANASNLFWQLCEAHFQKLIDACGDANKVAELRKVFARIVHQCFDTHCPKNTARQLDAWAKCRPNVGWYLRGEASKEKSAKKLKIVKVKF